jgi:hypothetical protein
MRTETPETHAYTSAKNWQFWTGHPTAYTRVPPTNLNWLWSTHLERWRGFHWTLACTHYLFHISRRIYTDFSSLFPSADESVRKEWYKTTAEGKRKSTPYEGRTEFVLLVFVNTEETVHPKGSHWWIKRRPGILCSLIKNFYRESQDSDWIQATKSRWSRNWSQREYTKGMSHPLGHLTKFYGRGTFQDLWRPTFSGQPPSQNSKDK